MAPEPMSGHNIRFPNKLWNAAQEATERNDERISDVLRRALADYVEKNS